MTLLEAVNLCLRSTGETGVAAIVSNHPKFQTILAEIDTVSKRLQSRQWWFNTAVRTLEPIVGGPDDGKIDTSGYTLVIPTWRSQDYFPFDGFLIDRSTGEPVTGQAVQAQLRWEYATTEENWDAMPGTFTDYVGTAAALSYASNYDADQLQLAKLSTSLKTAQSMVNADNIRYSKTNMFTSGSTGSALTRAWGNRYGRYYGQ